MTRENDVKVDITAQELAERGQGNDPGSRSYRALFDALESLPLPGPDEMTTGLVLAALEQARRQRRRDRLWLRSLLIALVVMLVLACGASLPRMFVLLADLPLLYPFSALSIALVGVLAGWGDVRRSLF